MTRRGRPPGSEELVAKAREIMGLEVKAEEVAYEVLSDNAETETETTTAPVAEDNSVAYAVVRNGDVYQLVSIPFNIETLQAKKGEVIFESTDRWEVQGNFTFRSEDAFLLKESL